jgi:hypothetical protein
MIAILVMICILRLKLHFINRFLFTPFVADFSDIDCWNKELFFLFAFFGWI